MTKKILIDETVVKQVLGWIEDAAVVLSHTSTAIQGGLGAEAEGVGGCSVKVLKDLREALEVNNKGVNALVEQAAWLPSAEWTACVKLPVTVHVRQQRPGETHVSTREGITPVKPDDLIMLGVSGEEYPIGREIFERTYRIGEAYEAGKSVVQQEPTEPVAGKTRPLGYLPKWSVDRLTGDMGKVADPLVWGLYTHVYLSSVEHGVAIYTSPQSAATQPLTDDELRNVLRNTNHMIRNAMYGSFWPELEQACRAIEAAHGITSTNQGE